MEELVLSVRAHLGVYISVGLWVHITGMEPLTWTKDVLEPSA